MPERVAYRRCRSRQDRHGDYVFLAEPQIDDALAQSIIDLIAGIEGKGNVPGAGSLRQQPISVVQTLASRALKRNASPPS